MKYTIYYIYAAVMCVLILYLAKPIFSTQKHPFFIWFFPLVLLFSLSVKYMVKIKYRDTMDYLYAIPLS